MRFTLTCLTVFTVSCAASKAQEAKPIELSIEARAIETPVLKYRLLPSEAEIKPGNAVPILLRLPWEQTLWMNQEYPKLRDWDSRGLDDPAWETSNGVLPNGFYAEMKRAAFRRDAFWEYPIGEVPSPHLILLPDVQSLFSFLGHGLSARIRYHLTKGELDKAREGILVGLANGRHLAQTPFYINQLVALSIHQVMLDRTAELISQPDSPNLYWALSTLPDSLLEINRASSLEGDIFGMTFPAVTDFDRERDDEEWSKMAEQLVEFLEQFGEIPAKQEPAHSGDVIDRLLQSLQLAEVNHISKAVRQVRAELPGLLKISAEKIEAMSDAEAGVRWYTHLRIAQDQHGAAVMSLPPREAWTELKKCQQETKAMREKTSTASQSGLDSATIYVAVWTLKRNICALRIIEAIRDHLASHDGQLPATLDELKQVSVPHDPLTDRPFEWSVDGKTAILKAPSLPADFIEPGTATGKPRQLVYRLQVKGTP